MMNANAITALADYNNYCNGVVLNVAAQLSEAEFSNTPSPSRESIKILLRHLLVVEAAYTARCRGDPFSFDSASHETFAEIQRFGMQTANDLKRLVAALTEDDLAREVQAPFGDQSLHFPLWQMLLHTFMHSARHRGELSIILSQLGHPLPIQDLIVQFTEASGQTWHFERT